MNSPRLLALSTLGRGGSAHGYEISRQAKLDRAGRWNEIKPGSLYHALHRMTGEALVAMVRTDREGNSPERTIYAITAAGRQELTAQRDAALHDTRLRPDPT